MFANRYLEKNKKPARINPFPSPGLGMSIVIPCIREPDILQTLDSLNQCALPDGDVEVIVLINHSELATKETRAFNYRSKSEIDHWIQKNKKKGITYFAPAPVVFKKKWAGAGLARKSGMDEAIRRFNFLNKPGGIIVSLDADTLVKNNYLTEIEYFFNNHPQTPAATIPIQHQTSGLSPKHLQGIRLYEKYMDYYKNALGFSGYPHPMFTVGSAFAVTAEAYVKRGGMNRRQAGEDFYFLQNLTQIGPVGEIDSTRVYPSARLSDRVPFGTGPVLQKWMNGTEDLSQTYNFQAFIDLKKLFDRKEHLFKIPFPKYKIFISYLPSSIGKFLIHSDFWEEIADLNKNCSNLKSFNIRFYQKFNAFKILKYLNFCHAHFFEKVSLNEQINKLQKILST